ncbi:MAG: M48 family metallopeptidase [Patescibacteria group bacterium]|nr:M48 family metallopeptidase [Patescibacteria group bacterium]MDD4304004.1 M48 family metallopeptidase [Patescibacteria group bacterium]MDD4695007.1 M48 family metallopeptidase [Patescibacteria group bacterium]
MKNYKLIRSRRKSVALEINKDAELIIRAPLFTPVYIIEKFVNQKNNWITKKQKIATDKKYDLKKLQGSEIKKITKQKAENIINKRVKYYSKLENIKYNKIKITNAKNRWGSCSFKNNINLSMRLAMAPIEIIDYVVIHELCHIKEKNHSKKFWNEVEKIMPNYKQNEKWLKTKGHLLSIFI